MRHKELGISTIILVYCTTVYEWCHSMCTVCLCGVMEDKNSHVSDHVFVLQLCVRGLGLQARRLQQETLWFGRAGESHPRSTHLFIPLFVSGRDCLLILFLLFMISPPFLSLCLFCWHVWITEGDWWVMTYWAWSNDVLCQHGSHGMLCSWWCRTLLPAQPPKLICCVLMLRHSIFLCGWLLSCWVIVALGEFVWVYVPLLWAEAVHPDNPQAQEVLGFHSMIILPTRDILWVCLSAAYYVCRRLLLRRNHMLPISTSRLSLHTVLLGVF